MKMFVDENILICQFSSLATKCIVLIFYYFSQIFHQNKIRLITNTITMNYDLHIYTNHFDRKLRYLKNPLIIIVKYEIGTYIELL